MNNQIYMDGEPLEIGNEVYCMLHGVGKVESINNESIFPIEIAFPHGCCTYTKNFRGLNNHKNRTLYWQRPEIIPPPKPRKKVTVYDWYIEWKIDKMHKNGINRVYGLTEDDVRRMYPNDLIQKIDGTEREVER